MTTRRRKKRGRGGEGRRGKVGTGYHITRFNCTACVRVCARATCTCLYVLSFESYFTLLFFIRTSNFFLSLNVLIFNPF